MDEWLGGEYLDEELRSLLERVSRTIATLVLAFSDTRLSLQMLDVDPFYRMTPKEAMTHPFWCDMYVLCLSCL